MKRISAYLLALTSACGVKPTHYPHTVDRVKFESDAELLVLANRFIATCDEADLKCTALANDIAGFSIKWDESVDLADNVAYCRVQFIGDNTLSRSIYMHPVAKDYSPDEVYILVAHESAHCLLNYDHAEGDKPQLMRSFLMNQMEIDEAGGPDAVIKAAFKNPIFFLDGEEHND